eukprot:1537711-Amphidinium_carterae.1
MAGVMSGEAILPKQAACYLLRICAKTQDMLMMLIMFNDDVDLLISGDKVSLKTAAALIC